MNFILLITITIIIVFIILSIVTYFLLKKHQDKVFKDIIEDLDRDKNLIISAPILSELSKVETLIKNEKLEDKYKNWQKRLYDIKENRIPAINEMIIDVDLFTNTKDKEELSRKIAKTQLEIAKSQENVDVLLGEIREITLSEEKYRSIILNLKSKYRKFVSEFNSHKNDYEDMEPIVELQLENIEKRFLDFDEVMSHNEYDEVVHIVKALNQMIEHMSIIILEIPNLILLSKKLIPKRIEEIENMYQDMKDKGYSLEFLKIDYNIEEIKKHIKDILGRIKVLNLEDCMFELKTILDYLDGTFNDFEKEKLSKKIYEENNNKFEKRLKRTDHIVKDIYNQLDDIKNMYHLKEKDIESIDQVNNKLNLVKNKYIDILENIKKSNKPYSLLINDIEDIKLELNKVEEDLDFTLKNLGSMYDDEVRAKDQLEEIEDLLKQCKIRTRTFKLPVIQDNYYVELSEANEAILEIVKELEQKPIRIKTLNMRVDTARDLVLKLFNTTSDMIKKASLAEAAIVYGNKYRSTIPDVERALENAEKLFYEGHYQDSLNVVVSVLEDYDTRIHKYLTNVY